MEKLMQTQGHHANATPEGPAGNLTCSHCASYHRTFSCSFLGVGGVLSGLGGGAYDRSEGQVKLADFGLATRMFSGFRSRCITRLE